MCNFNFASVNMQRHNAPMHTILNSNKTDDILFIQEPWFNCIGVARNNDQRKEEMSLEEQLTPAGS
jgi:hypothetical protein